MLSVYKRGARWWIRGSFLGRKVRTCTLDTKDRQTADLLRRDLEERMLAGETSARSHRLSWPELLRTLHPSLAGNVRPSTLKKYDFVTTRFGRFLEEAARVGDVRQITPETIAAYQRARMLDVHPTRSTPIGPAGVTSDLRILHRVFAVAIEHDLCASNPVRAAVRAARRVSNSLQTITQPFTDKEIDRMHRACQERDPRGAPLDLWPIITVFVTTGLRISDVIHLPKSAINDASGHIVMTTQKRGRLVSLPIHPAAAAAFESWRAGENAAQRSSPYLFSTASGRPIENLAAYLHRLWKQAGIAGAHPHRFRDTFAVRVLQQGGTLYDVAKLLGISHAVAERHYTPYVQELQERGRKLVNAIQIPSTGERQQNTIGA